MRITDGRPGRHEDISHLWGLDENTISCHYAQICGAAELHGEMRLTSFEMTDR